MRPLLPLVWLAIVLSAGCVKQRDDGPSGCRKDTDCKGSRVCVAGSCTESVVKDKAPAASPKPTPLTPDKAPPAAPAPAPNPNAIAADGLPAVIPPPSSPPPTTAEWDSVTREVTVKGSSARNCETKMVREWLRVTCRRFANNLPVDASGQAGSGQQAYYHTVPNVQASLVVQVIQGRTYRGMFSWRAGARVWGAELMVVWPSSAARPSLYFEP